ncbi:MAG TPA: cadherin-like domain-containing protein [Thermoanaerobaculia bacterium]|nr:cadherin-like domain-containing protein [Thermoanaerobaculia bacterium]
MRSRSLSVALFSLVLSFSLHAATLEVEGPQDSLAGPPSINHCTLRKAIINANNDGGGYPQCLAGSGADTITFLFPGTITTAIAGISEDAAATGDYDITESLTIIGHPDGTIIDGNDLDRLFHVNPLNTPGVVVTLRNLHIRNGTGLGSAGCILMSGGTLNLENVTISGCHVNGGDGGALLLSAGTVNLVNSTISGNTAAHHGGALVNDGGTLNITNSTITNNSSGFSNLTGGIRSAGIATTLRNTIVAGNAGNDLPNIDGTFTSLGYNIIGELGTMVGNPTIVPNAGDQIDVNFAAVALLPLTNNGGPTPTHALGGASLALDKGHSSGSTSDQRGLTRPCDGASLANAPGGDGGDVGAYEEQLACVTNVDPDAVDDNASVAEDSGANAVDVLANDSDANVSDTLIITAVTQGAHGSVAITGGGTGVSYTPNANYFGSDSFTYTIDDGNGGSDTATVSVNVTSVNDLPVAAPDNYAMNQDTTLNVAAPGVLGNDSDLEGPMQAVLNVDVAHGDLTLNADGSFTYQPDPGYAGTDSFTYHVYDGTDSSNIVTVTISIADTQPPTITASVDVSSLWPPNHQLVDVGLHINATDNTGTATTSFVVLSDEDDGDSSDASGSLLLRAERAGSGGRVYLIAITSTDAFSNTSHQCLTVVVPKSQSAKDIGSVNAQAAAALAQCPAPAGYFVIGD